MKELGVAEIIDKTKVSSELSDLLIPTFETFLSFILASADEIILKIKMLSSAGWQRIGKYAKFAQKFLKLNLNQKNATVQRKVNFSLKLNYSTLHMPKN